MRNILIGFMILGSIVFLGLFATPFGWKLQGMSFVNSTKNSTEIVYKGDVIAIYPKDCLVTFNIETGIHSGTCN